MVEIKLLVYRIREGDETDQERAGQLKLRKAATYGTMTVSGARFWVFPQAITVHI